MEMRKNRVSSKKTGLRNGGNNVERRGRRMDSVREAGKYI